MNYGNRDADRVPAPANLPDGAESRRPLRAASQVTSNVPTAGATPPTTDVVNVYVPFGAYAGIVNFRSFVKAAFAGTSTEKLPRGKNADVALGGTTFQLL